MSCDCWGAWSEGAPTLIIVSPILQLRKPCKVSEWNDGMIQDSSDVKSQEKENTLEATSRVQS